MEESEIEVIARSLDHLANVTGIDKYKLMDAILMGTDLPLEVVQEIEKYFE